MRVSILGKVWTCRRTRLKAAHGECDSPDTPGKEIRIDDRLEGTDELETLIHEFTHAADWWKSEEYISMFAHDLAVFLEREGYRKTT